MGVHNVVDVFEGDALREVEALLLLEGGCGEVALELLVGEVDAQLLEGVHLEDLEAEDIEQPDELVPRHVAHPLAQRSIDTHH